MYNISSFSEFIAYFTRYTGDILMYCFLKNYNKLMKLELFFSKKKTTRLVKYDIYKYKELPLIKTQKSIIDCGGEGKVEL